MKAMTDNKTVQVSVCIEAQSYRHYDCDIFTTCNSTSKKVMFSQASVSHSV